MATRSVNQVQLIGRLSKDVETRQVNGKPVSNLTVVTSDSWKDKATGEWKEQAQFHSCVLWGNENVLQYLVKGTQVRVEGSLQNRSYEDKDGNKKYVTEVKVKDLMLFGGARNEKPIEAPAFEVAAGDSDDTDLPF